MSQAALRVGETSRRWMWFVDGENFTLRGQEHATSNGLTLLDGPFFRRNVFLWVPRLKPHAIASFNRVTPPTPPAPIRAYYYTSEVGDQQRLDDSRERLWALGFQPEVFKKERQQQKTKGVDITLAKDVLSHAFMDNYDVAVLVAGDADYVPLVNEVKRLGKTLIVCFFSDSGLSSKLRLAADDFLSVDQAFRWGWEIENSRPSGT
jgi:hypothetical protein